MKVEELIEYSNYQRNLFGFGTTMMDKLNIWIYAVQLVYFVYGTN